MEMKGLNKSGCPDPLFDPKANMPRIAVDYGVGRHIQFVPPENLPKFFSVSTPDIRVLGLIERLVSDEYCADIDDPTTLLRSRRRPREIGHCSFPTTAGQPAYAAS